ncbi:MAG TPA: hypothetical protein VFZ16_02825 [Hyphomicrobiaceae bacterium]|nr:hypothetical protein [Hyphomicrobiaceae bacterium]
MPAATMPGTIGACQPTSGVRSGCRGELGHGELVGYSTLRNLIDKAYTVVWLALSLGSIDRQNAST